MENILWFSRHQMTDPQREALGLVNVKQVNRTISHAVEIQDEIDQADIIAIVAPIGLQAEFLRAANGKPVIMAVNDRKIVKDPDGGEDKVTFEFVKWERLIEVTVKKEDFILSDCEKQCGRGNFPRCMDNCAACVFAE